MCSKHYKQNIQRKERQKERQIQRSLKYKTDSIKVPIYDEPKQKSDNENINLALLPIYLLKIVLEYAEPIPQQMPMMEHNFDDIVAVHQEISHDGYDRYGPKSNLYDMYILLKVDGVKYIASWSREDWYGGSESDQLYYFDGYRDFNDYMIEIRTCYSMRHLCKKFDKYLHKRKRLSKVTTY